MEQINKEIACLSEYLEETHRLFHALRRETIPRKVYFRGHASADYELVPSVARQVAGYYNLPFGFERRIVEYVEESFPELLCNIRTPIDLIAFLQHHGAPTRLLDISSSSLVGLYFAVAEKEDTDGEVFVFCPPDFETERYPMDMAIADSYRMINGSVGSLDDFFARVRIQDYFLEQQATTENLVTEAGGGAEWILGCCREPLFVRSFHHSHRQRIQQSSFILFPNDIIEEGPLSPYFCERISPLPKDNAVIAARYNIPSHSKKKILSQLEVAGISEATLFSDSIDVICKEAGRIARSHVC